MGQQIRHVMTSSTSTVAPHTSGIDGARIMTQPDAVVVPATEYPSSAEMVTDRGTATAPLHPRTTDVGDVRSAAAP
jgi:hypothetical protein